MINVLMGDMSLVGPRPERPDLSRSSRTGAELHEKAHGQGGITGWAQGTVGAETPLEPAH